MGLPFLSSLRYGENDSRVVCSSGQISTRASPGTVGLRWTGDEGFVVEERVAIAVE